MHHVYTLIYLYLYLHTKFYIPHFCSLLVTAINTKAKLKFPTDAMLLFYILQKIAFRIIASFSHIYYDA
jgi:hypothetical protein